WMGHGPDLVLPVIGPSTVLDCVSLVGDWQGGMYTYTSVGSIENVPVRNSLWGLKVVDTRASLLDTTDTVDRVALDPYSFVRDASLQRRAAIVRGTASGEANVPDYRVPDYSDDAADDSAAVPAGSAAPAPKP